MANTYRLKIVNGDKHFEAEGDKSFVLDMWKKFQGGIKYGEIEPVNMKSTKDIKQSPLDAQNIKKISLGEFIRQLTFKKHTDIVLAFGYFLEKNLGMKEFGPADVNKCYYDAKMESSNTSQMLIQNIKTGRIMQSKGGKTKGSKQFMLTQTGEEFIGKALAKKNVN